MDRLMDGQNGGQINDPITDGPSKKKKNEHYRKREWPLTKARTKRKL